MSGTPVVVKLLAEQRKRCFATIMNAAETAPWWAELSLAQQSHFRDQVRTAISVFYDLTRDVLKVTDEDTVRNDLALDLIRSLHTQTREIATQLKRTS